MSPVSLLQRLSLLIVATCLAASNAAGEAWRKNCTLLNNRAIAPFVYLSQSDMAVVAFHESLDYKAFESGKPITFTINPICYVKGYAVEPVLTVVSGTQSCGVTGLSTLLEYPHLFFLRKRPGSTSWLLLNSGEYLHIVDSKGILFGIGPAGSKFPQTCGVQRNKTVEEGDACTSNRCRHYCSYKIAPAGNCLDKRKELKKYLPNQSIPEDRKPWTPPVARKPSDASTTEGPKTGATSLRAVPGLLIGVAVIALGASQ